MGEQLPDGLFAETKFALGGNWLLTITPVAFTGPRFDTVSVNVMLLVTSTGSGESVCVRTRSASGAALASVTTALFERSGSNVLVDTTALFVSDPRVVAVAVTVMVAEPFAGKVPRLQDTTAPATEQEPRVELKETKARLGGSVFVKVTFEAGEGPRFVTIAV